VETPLSASIGIAKVWATDRHEYACDQQTGGKRKEEWDDSLEN
jgi:hypothetical protein